MNKTIKILRIALDANPESWETRRHLVELLMEEGQYREARELLVAATGVPSSEDDELFLAKHLVEHHPAQAAPYVDRVLRRNKGSAEGHWLKAQVTCSEPICCRAPRRESSARVHASAPGAPASGLRTPDQAPTAALPSGQPLWQPHWPHCAARRGFPSL